MMNRFSLSNLAAATMVVSVGLMVGAILTVAPTPSQAAKGGGQGKGGGQPLTPAKITFCEVNCDPSDPPDPFFDVEIKSDGIDGTAYTDEGIGSEGLEVTIDSAANQGNIRLEGNDSGRKLRIAVPDNDKCGLPTEPSPLYVDFQFLRVEVDEEVDGGVFGMAEGESKSVIVPMGIRFGYPTTNANIFFLDYRPELKGPNVCKGKSGLVKVVRNSETSWTVTDDGRACVRNHPDEQGDRMFHRHNEFLIRRRTAALAASRAARRRLCG